MAIVISGSCVNNELAPRFRGAIDHSAWLMAESLQGLIPDRTGEGPVFVEFYRLRPAAGDDLPGLLVDGVIQQVGVDLHGDEILSPLLPDLGDLDRADGDVLQAVDLLVWPSAVSASSRSVANISSVRMFLTPDMSRFAHAPWIRKKWSMQPSVKRFSSNRGSIWRMWRRPVATSLSCPPDSYACIGGAVRPASCAGDSR